MENENRLIRVGKAVHDMCNACSVAAPGIECKPKNCSLVEALRKITGVDAVEIPDKKLLRAVNLLIKQYEHSKRSDYVHNPVAHAFYHTWKQLDRSGFGEMENDVVGGIEDA